MLLAKDGDSTVVFSSSRMSAVAVDLANARSAQTNASMKIDISAGVRLLSAFGDSAQWISDVLTAGDNAHSAVGGALLNRQTTVGGRIASTILGLSTTAVIRSQIVLSGTALIRRGSAHRVSSRHTTFGGEIAFNSDGRRASSFKMQHNVWGGRQDNEYGAVGRAFISDTMACTRSGGARSVADNRASSDGVKPPYERQSEQVDAGYLEGGNINVAAGVVVLSTQSKPCKKNDELIFYLLLLILFIY